MTAEHNTDAQPRRLWAFSINNPRLWVRHWQAQNDLPVDDLGNATAGELLDAMARTFVPEGKEDALGVAITLERGAVRFGSEHCHVAYLLDQPVDLRELRGMRGLPMRLAHFEMRQPEDGEAGDYLLRQGKWAYGAVDEDGMEDMRPRHELVAGPVTRGVDLGVRTTTAGRTRPS